MYIYFPAHIKSLMRFFIIWIWILGFHSFQSSSERPKLVTKSLVRAKCLRCQAMGVGRIFSRGGTMVFFHNFSRGEPKVVTFVFSHLKLRKQLFFLKISKSGGGQGPSSDAHGVRYCAITNFKLELMQSWPQPADIFDGGKMIAICFFT